MKSKKKVKREPIYTGGDRAVMILFPGLTHHGKSYQMGEVEREPTNYLIECAEKKTVMFHRDEGKNIRIARFCSPGDTFDKDEQLLMERFEEQIDPGVPDEDLNDLNSDDLVKVAYSLGIRRQFAKEMDEDNLKRSITLLRKV